VVNCTRSNPLYPNDFVHYHAPIDDHHIKLQSEMDPITAFIDDAAAHRGKVSNAVVVGGVGVGIG
jgi:protein-tyrosine phosphatase